MEDYPSAAARHWDNVEFLSLSNRWQEAAYLAGYVAECSFKALFQASSLPNVRGLGHSLTTLSRDALALALVLTPENARYRVEGGVDGWSTEQRYETTAPQCKPEFCRMVQQADEIARKVLIGMVLDGLLPEVPQ
ncbi:MAG TPA: hypothetical protein PLJ78_09220 [Anaerolineae bacterium]|nr:hypothetical protein [Anaerolineae bacterium]HQK14107.1 hypothetical protein [Anaerolineae bacterium]